MQFFTICYVDDVSSTIKEVHLLGESETEIHQLFYNFYENAEIISVEKNKDKTDLLHQTLTSISNSLE
ncbi:hypothetical protein EDD73_1204 [Heliophilum fasciatum]|uniref:Uncharacterized protein n=1 Tax=Heliophilum fasciatum TaxID=35700 RepID=A0A4R2RK75_9FIRM|nr:hypothetical protein [Heliophilum fasciatum]TCP62587.1 hypothetical protein EDD73_1204 [Heliophilum fasciatum]